MERLESTELQTEGRLETIYRPTKIQRHYIDEVFPHVDIPLDDEGLKDFSVESIDTSLKDFGVVVQFMEGTVGAEAIDWDSVSREVVRNSGILHKLSEYIVLIKRKKFDLDQEPVSETDAKKLDERVTYVFTHLKDILIAVFISNKTDFLVDLDDFYSYEQLLTQVFETANPEEIKLIVEHLEYFFNPVDLFSRLQEKHRENRHLNLDGADEYIMLSYVKFMLDNESVAYQEHIRHMLLDKGINPIAIKDLMDPDYTSISDQSANILKTLDNVLFVDHPYEQDFISIAFLKNELARVFNVSREMFKSWHFESAQDKTSLETRLGFMEQIETMSKGGVRLLYDNYGICEFNRYPLGMLMDQIKQHEEHVPYGIIIFPKSDYNDAFDTDLDLLFSLYEQMGDKYLMRCLECGNGQDVYRALSSLNTRYGDEDKISFMILGGHGRVDGITLGDERVSSGSFTEITKSMVQESRGLDRIKDYFVQSPQVVLFSCSTGVKGGIAQELAKKLSARVVAPKVPTNPVSIKYTEGEEGQIKFDVKYNDGKAALYVGK